MHSDNPAAQPTDLDKMFMNIVRFIGAQGPDYGITSKVSSQIWIIAGVIISLNRMYKRAIMFQNLKKRQQQINQDNYKEADATESSSTDFKVVKY